MSDPIPINKEKPFSSSNYFSSWFAAKKAKEEIEEEIFVMDDDEVPPKLKEESEKESEESEESDEESEKEKYDICQDCFNDYPCSNILYYGSCYNCEENICNIITESINQGILDMKSDIKNLWAKDVVKVWTAFLTICYFNIPYEAMTFGAMYLFHKKMEEIEKEIINREINKINDVDDSESDDEKNSDFDDKETKKCV
jgi:hypothetical protein